MVPKIKKMLYASDLSDNSIPALAWAMSLANQYDAPISFLHVLEEMAPHTAHTIRSFMGEEQWLQIYDKRQSEAYAEITERINSFCEKVKNEIQSCPLVVKETLIEQGVPSQVIIAQAESKNFDLIVMGTHGGGVFKDAMIGSTARRVLRRSNIPVLVIPLPDNEE